MWARRTQGRGAGDGGRALQGDHRRDGEAYEGEGANAQPKGGAATEAGNPLLARVSASRRPRCCRRGAPGGPRARRFAIWPRGSGALRAAAPPEPGGSGPRPLTRLRRGGLGRGVRAPGGQGPPLAGGCFQVGRRGAPGSGAAGLAGAGLRRRCGPRLGPDHAGLRIEQGRRPLGQCRGLPRPGPSARGSLAARCLTGGDPSGVTGVRTHRPMEVGHHRGDPSEGLGDVESGDRTPMGEDEALELCGHLAARREAVAR